MRGVGGERGRYENNVTIVLLDKIIKKNLKNQNKKGKKTTHSHIRRG